MATYRTLRPKRLAHSERQWKLSCDTARLLYENLLLNADINGTFKNNASLIKSCVFPIPEDELHDTQHIRGYIQEFVEQGLIKIYTLEGKEYIWFPDFVEGQAATRRWQEQAENPITEEIKQQNERQWREKSRGSTDKKEYPEYRISESTKEIINIWNEKHLKEVKTPLVLSTWEEKDLDRLIKTAGKDRVINMLRFFYACGNENYPIGTENWNAKYFFKKQQDILDHSSVGVK